MNVCCYCAVQLICPLEICPHHLHEYEQTETWAVENRIYCNFIHRKQKMPRMSREERERDAEEFAQRYWEDLLEEVPPRSWPMP